MMMINDLWKARLLLLGASALYGTTFSMVKLLGDTMPVNVSLVLRFGFGAVAALPWLLGNNNQKDGNNDARTAAWLGFEIGLWDSVGFFAQALGLATTSASESAFICSLAAVTVPLIEYAAGKQLHSRQWVGALCAVLGVAFLELEGDNVHGMLNYGDIMSLIQPFAFGVGFWKMEQAMHRFPDQATRLTAAQLLAVFLASVAYGWSATDMATLQSYPWGEWMTSSSTLFGLVWTGLITTALTIYMETKAMETLSAAETTILCSTEPLWGAAFAAGVMGEQLGLNTLVGACFILTACVYSNLGWEGIQNLILPMTSNYVDDDDASDDTKNMNSRDVESNQRSHNPSQQISTPPAQSIWKKWVCSSNSISAKWATRKTISDVTDTAEQANSSSSQKML